MKHNVKRHAVTQPLDQSIKLIPLTKGLNTIVDVSRYGHLSQWNWSAVKKQSGFYAYRMGADRHKIPMHREITGFYRTDHANGNTLDNREENLRSCTTSQNNRNCKIHRDNKSGCKGVSWSKSNRGWIAQVRNGGKNVYLGTHPTKEGAAQAYRNYVVKHFPEFHRLN